MSDHPNVLTQPDSPLIVDVAQVYALGSVIWFQGANQFVIGPMASRTCCVQRAHQRQHSMSRTMLQRDKLEKAEGDASDNTVLVQPLA